MSAAASVDMLSVTDGVQTGQPQLSQGNRGDSVITWALFTTPAAISLGPPISWATSTPVTTATKYINSFIDFRRIQTDYTPNPHRQYHPDHVSAHPRGYAKPDTTANAAVQYGWAGCPDPNNRDANTRITSTASPMKEAIPPHSCVTPTSRYPH